MVKSKSTIQIKKSRHIFRNLVMFFIFALPLSAFLTYRYTRTTETMLPFIISQATDNGIELQLNKMSGSIVTGIQTDSISLTFPESGLTIRASRASADFSLWDIIMGDLGFSSVRINDAQVIFAETVSSEPDTVAQDSGFPILPKLILDQIDIHGFKLALPGNIVISADYLGGDIFMDSLEIYTDLEAMGLAISPFTGKLDKWTLQASGNRGEYDITQFNFEQGADILSTEGSIQFPENEPAVFSLKLDSEVRNINRWLNPENRAPLMEQATANLNVDFEGSYKDFYAQVKMTHANSLNLNLNEGTLNVFYSTGEWYLDRLILVTNFGYLEGTFGYSRDKNLYALANLKEVYLDSSQTDDRPISFDGWLNIAATNIDLHELTGSASLIIDHPSWGEFKANQFSFYAEAEAGLITLLDNSKVVITDESSISLDGTFNKKNEIDFSAFAYDNQLSDYSEPLSGMPIEGRFTGFIGITGQIDNPSIFADVQVDTLRQEYFSLENVSLQANILDIAERRRGNISLISYGGDILSHPVQMAKADLFIEDNLFTVKDITVKDQNRQFEVQGYADFSKNEVRIDSLFARYNMYEFSSTAPFQFAWANNKYSGTEFHFSDNYGGTLQATNWTYPLDEKKSSVNISNLNLGKLTLLFGDEYVIDGKLSAIIEGNRQVEKGGPFLNGLVIADSLDFGGFDIDQLTIRGTYDSLGLDLPDLNISGKNFSLKGSGKWIVSSGSEKPQTLKINWDNFPIQSLSYFTPYFEEVRGWVNGNMEFGGSLNAPRIEINLAVENGVFRNTRFDEVILKTIYANSLLNIYDSYFIFKGDTGFAEIKIPLNLNLTEPEEILLQGPIFFHSHADFKNKNLNTNFIPYVEAISGDIKWDINGSLKDSTVLFSPGFVRFENAELDITELKNQILDASGELRFDLNNIYLEKFSGYTERKHSGFNWLLNAIQSFFTSGDINQGELTGSGKINLQNIYDPDTHLDFQGRNLYFEYLPFSLKTTADINDFTIDIGDEINISGDIDLQYADLAIEPDLVNKLTYLYSSGGLDKNKVKQNVNLSIYIPGNATVHSEGFKLINNFKMEIVGELKIFQGRNTGVIGTLEMIDGNVYYIKDFEIQYGRLDFLSPTEIDTRIDLVATRMEKGKYIIQFTAKGSLNKLTYELSVRDATNNQVIPMAEKDVIALLTLGMETQEYASDSLLVTGNELLTEATGKALEGLARKYNFADKVEFQSKVYNPNTAGTASFFTYGKYLTNDLYVEYQGRLSQMDVSGAYIPMPSFTWQAGNQVGIRYRINRNWSLNTTMFRTFENNNKYRIDLKWTKEFSY